MLWLKGLALFCYFCVQANEDLGTDATRKHHHCTGVVTIDDSIRITKYIYMCITGWNLLQFLNWAFLATKDVYWVILGHFEWLEELLSVFMYVEWLSLSTHSLTHTYKTSKVTAVLSFVTVSIMYTLCTECVLKVPLYVVVEMLNHDSRRSHTTLIGAVGLGLVTLSL